MRKSGQSVPGLVLLILGILIFLGLFGVNVGSLIVFALSVAFMIGGYRLTKRTDSSFKKFVGIVGIIIGVCMFLSALPFLIGIAISLGLVYYGWQLMKKEKQWEPEPSGGPSTDFDWVELDNNFEADWKQFLKKKMRRDTDEHN